MVFTRSKFLHPVALGNDIGYEKYFIRKKRKASNVLIPCNAFDTLDYRGSNVPLASCDRMAETVWYEKTWRQRFVEQRIIEAKERHERWIFQNQEADIRAGYMNEAARQVKRLQLWNLGPAHVLPDMWDQDAGQSIGQYPLVVPQPAPVVSAVEEEDLRRLESLLECIKAERRSIECSAQESANIGLAGQPQSGCGESTSTARSNVSRTSQSPTSTATSSTTEGSSVGGGGGSNTTANNSNTGVELYPYPC